ncbi:hypothetical protein JRQ81_000820 [Phrynocephalus forsythii]|uniref:Fibrous sheath-interacting protein 1 n=1 Tax=Phrynocephalus forsythii TaxID=171643 RepID=A0A9Q0Y5Z6_9SAUR|nr:hypothetical protein JRQ81_000820 [Phrynocephalus forsythii]
MDITRGSLDEISRPASTSRINHGNKALSASLEILTPDPDPLKVDFYYNCTEDNSKENTEENGAKKIMASEEIANGKSSNNCEVIIQSTCQVEECSSSPGNSGDDCATNELSSSGSGSPNKPATLQNVTTKSTNQEDSEKKDVDPLILKAIKKMKRLDQILANKQSQEKEVKKQGKEIRRKLWEELQCMASRSSSVIVEEVENTNRFLALTSPLPETPESSTAEEAEMFVSVFHTQIHPENYECDRRTTKQGEISLIEERAKSSIKKIENMHQKSKTNCKKPPDFVKKNIELVKESANQVVMLEEEKKRLSELLRDTETESTELQIIEDEAAGSIVPGEGYTPEPMEYRHLTEINAKLKVMISEEDLSSIQSSCSEIPKQIFQESLAYANRKLETIPGEKVLRDSKEERNQQNRLKEIDQQLKNLEETPDVLPRLSEEQLSALLEECMQTLRREHSLTLTKSFSEGRSPRYDIVQNTIPNSRNESLDDAQSGRMLVSQEMVASEDKDMSAADTMEACGLKFSQPLIDSHLTEQKENDNEDIQEKTVPRNTSEGYFMSLALSTDRPPKPFLETFLCISPNNELSTDVSIPSMPLKTREDELTGEDGNEE